MPYSYHTAYHSRVYRDFRGIDPGAHREILHFYEMHETAIRAADFEEYFEMLVAYTEALFETGAYRQHLLMADVAIAESMSQELDFSYGSRVFQRMLFRKAASCFNLREYSQAEYLLGQLMRINPDHKQALRFYRKCRYHQHPRWLYQVRACCIFLFLMTALVICLELLLIRPFYALYTPLIEASRNTMFAIALSLLAGAEAGHFWLTRRAPPISDR